jgi:hypothetical protein
MLLTGGLPGIEVLPPEPEEPAAPLVPAPPLPLALPAAPLIPADGIPPLPLPLAPPALEPALFGWPPLVFGAPPLDVPLTEFVMPALDGLPLVDELPPLLVAVPPLPAALPPSLPGSVVEEQESGNAPTHVTHKTHRFNLKGRMNFSPTATARFSSGLGLCARSDVGCQKRSTIYSCSSRVHAFRSGVFAPFDNDLSKAHTQCVHARVAESSNEGRGARLFQLSFRIFIFW